MAPGAGTVKAADVAPRPSTLEGKTIGQLWDDLFRGDEIFPILEEELGRRFPGVRFVRHGTFGSTHGRDEQRVLAELPAVTAAPGPAGVRVWQLVSRGWGPRTGRPLPEAMVLKETRSNSQIPTPFPHRFPLNSHALTSVEGLLGQDEIDAAIQTTSTSKARRVDFGGCGPTVVTPSGFDRTAAD